MDSQARIRSMVDEHVTFVSRTLRKAGVPPSELDDEVQRTFIIAARRLEDVELGAERGFLFQVAVNLASHTRRTLARRREVFTDQTIERIEAIATPEHLTDRKQLRMLLNDIVGSLHETLRAVFILHEFEEMKLGEIAARLRLPRGTVSSRLRRAREQIRQHVAAIELAADLETRGVQHIEEPPAMRRETASALGRALLRAGGSTPMRMTSTHARTLAALGLLPAAGSP
jgi:RNA polymerase sigma-70 factor (ECF subfamily)